MVSDIASQLGITTEPAAAYQGLIEAIIRLVPAEDDSTAKKASLARIPEAGQGVLESDEEYANAEEIIKRHCESQWQDDYSMRSYCEEQQRLAVDNLRHQLPKGVPSEVFRQIRAKAAREWPEDFGMRLYIENQQIEAYRKLQGP